MAKLRHLGIRTEDTGKLASFYVDVFDRKVIHKSKEEGAVGIEPALSQFG